MKATRVLAIFCGVLWSVAALAGPIIKTVLAGATDQTVTFKLLDNTTGLPVAGIAYNASGMDLEYWRHGANAATDITEATQTANGAHSDGGFVSLGHGNYRLDLPDAAVASGATAVDIQGTVTGYVIVGGTVQLVAYNNQDGVRLGLTALPNAAAEASGGLYTRGTGAGQVNQAANGQLDTRVVMLDEDTATLDLNATTIGTVTTATAVTTVNGLAADVITAASIAAAAINDSELNVTGSEFTAIAGFAANALNAADIDPDVTTELQSGLATAAALTTVDDLLDTEIFDIRRAIGPATTTIATLASQTSFTLTAGSADDNAYNGFALNTIDVSTAVQQEVGIVCDYTGSTRTVTLCADPGVYTIATTDNVVLLPAFLTTGVDVLTIEGTDATDQLDTHAAAGLDAAATRAALGLSTANLDTQLGAIDDYVDTEVAAILVDTGTTLDDFLDTEVAAILSDTNAILVDTGTTLDDFLDTEVAAILTAVDTEVAAILADTDEVQTTLAAGGTIESLVDDLPAITTAVGTTIPALVTAVDDYVDTEVTALMNARTQLFPGGVDADSVLTSDSGDTNTLVDTELTFSAAQDIDGAYVVRSDGQRCFVDSFVPATDVIEFGACTFTGAWSTQTYKIYPAGTQ